MEDARAPWRHWLRSHEAWSAKPEAPHRAARVEASGHESAPVAPSVPETAGWEAQFAWGLYHSKRACLASESGQWALDQQSWAGVPREMLRAEELLGNLKGAPVEQQRQKTAERVGGPRVTLHIACSTPVLPSFLAHRLGPAAVLPREVAGGA